MVKVACLGAAGGIGQPLSLLLKANPLVSDLALFDLVNTPGVAADLGHINTKSVVKGFMGDDQLQDALTGCQIVVIPAGVPRKPGMTRDDLFNINAGIVKNLATAAAKYCPEAYMCIISNPVNSTVPIGKSLGFIDSVTEVFRSFNVLNPKKIFGVTTLDLVRASAFVSQIKQTDPSTTTIPVIGGHSGATIVPVLSGTGLTFSQDELAALTKRIQFGGDEVVAAKNGTGSATLSMAFAGARFVNSILEAIVLGKPTKEYTYIASDAVPGCEYFSTLVEFGSNGVSKIHPVPSLNEYEKTLFAACVAELKPSISKGIEFVKAKI